MFAFDAQADISQRSRKEPVGRENNLAASQTYQIKSDLNLDAADGVVLVDLNSGPACVARNRTDMDIKLSTCSNSQIAFTEEIVATHKSINPKTAFGGFLLSLGVRYVLCTAANTLAWVSWEGGSYLFSEEGKKNLGSTYDGAAGLATVGLVSGALVSAFFCKVPTMVNVGLVFLYNSANAP